MVNSFSVLVSKRPFSCNRNKFTNIWQIMQKFFHLFFNNTFFLSYRGR